MADSPAKSRLLTELAAKSGNVNQTRADAAKALTERDATALRAQAAGAGYDELMAASGLSKVAVHKMLKRANGGNLRGGKA